MTKLKDLFSLCLMLVASFIFFSCGQKLTITRSYIYYSEWGKGQYQGFQISKIKFHDSTISIYNSDFNQFQLSNYSIDTNFCWVHFALSSKYDSKSFFNKPNEGVRWRKCTDLHNEEEVIGLLELNTWYVILELRGTIDYFVFVDNDGKIHTYSVGPTNW